MHSNRKADIDVNTPSKRGWFAILNYEKLILLFIESFIMVILLCLLTIADQRYWLF